MDKAVSFGIKRLYCIYHTKQGVSRGYNAHRNLRQVAICLAGKYRMILADGRTLEEVLLDSPTKDLVIEDMVWRKMHDFRANCVLLVLASEHYEESGYI